MARCSLPSPRLQPQLRWRVLRQHSQQRTTLPPFQHPHNRRHHRRHRMKQSPSAPFPQAPTIRRRLCLRTPSEKTMTWTATARRLPHHPHTHFLQNPFPLVLVLTLTVVLVPVLVLVVSAAATATLTPLHPTATATATTLMSALGERLIPIPTKVQPTVLALVVVAAMVSTAYHGRSPGRQLQHQALPSEEHQIERFTQLLQGSCRRREHQERRRCRHHRHRTRSMLGGSAACALLCTQGRKQATSPALHARRRGLSSANRAQTHTAGCSGVRALHWTAVTAAVVVPPQLLLLHRQHQRCFRQRILGTTTRFLHQRHLQLEPEHRTSHHRRTWRSTCHPRL